MRMGRDEEGKDRNNPRWDLGHYFFLLSLRQSWLSWTLQKEKALFSKVVLKLLKNIIQILINFRKGNFRKQREGNLSEKYKSDN